MSLAARKAARKRLALRLHQTDNDRPSAGIAMVEWLKLGAVSLLLSMLIAAMAGIYYRVP